MPEDRNSSDARDEMYAAAYTEDPLDEPDEWGDLASFLTSVAR